MEARWSARFQSTTDPFGRALLGSPGQIVFGKYNMSNQEPDFERMTDVARPHSSATPSLLDLAPGALSEETSLRRTGRLRSLAR